MRLTVNEIDLTLLRCTDVNGKNINVQLQSTPFVSIIDRLCKGDIINIIGSNKLHGSVIPDIVVFDPDQLIDVTLLCSCHKNYAFNATNSFISRFEDHEISWQIQLGNLANDFFCVAVNNKNQFSNKKDLYLKTLKKSFLFSALTYTTISGINKDFFRLAKIHFENILNTVTQTLPASGIEPDMLQLELQFLSPELGLQGRMDALTVDRRTIIELKSGKYDEFYGGIAKEEHALQMQLYKEILHYSLGINNSSIKSILFYSRYPKLLPINGSLRILQNAIAVRNEIVLIDRMIRENKLSTILNNLKEEDFTANSYFSSIRNQNNKHLGKLYYRFQRPAIIDFIDKIHSMQPIVASYVNTFASFIAREQYYAKINFSDIWNTTLNTQCQNGNAIRGLHLFPLYSVDGSIEELQCNTNNDISCVNFRKGDVVFLYKVYNTSNINTDLKNPICSQIFRATITGISKNTIFLKLTFKQSSAKVFEQKFEYAISVSYTESTYQQAYKGIMKLTSIPQERVNLLLGITKPTIPTTAQIKNDETEINIIMQKINYSSDYFLLVGPPGTGKTNIALRKMVEMFLKQDKNILLMAYTNQAVDEICHVLAEIYPQFIRLGNEISCAIEYQNRLLNNILKTADSRNDIIDILSPIKVFVGTIASITSKQEIFKFKNFDITIVDEASQVLEPQILPILSVVNKFILIGDHKQLPAVVLQDRKESTVNSALLRCINLTNCADSYFERMYSLVNKWNLDKYLTATLTFQGRMHQDIMNFANRYFYNSQLNIVGLPHQTGTLPCNFKAENKLIFDIATHRMIFANVESKENTNKFNLAEAKTVAQIIDVLSKIYQERKEIFNPATSIGIIVPFRAQIPTIRNCIKDCLLAEQMTIDTVERYQGSQRDVIIFNTVIHNTDQIDMISSPVEMSDGTYIDRKLNVAITRARKQFIIVGSQSVLSRSTLYTSLMNECYQLQTLKQTDL